MTTRTKAQVLRIYVGEQDQWHGGPLYAAIVGRLKEAGIVGITVLHGIEGYGTHGQVHTERIEVLFQSLPIVIEAVDVPDRIALALPLLDEMVSEGLATVHDVEAIRYRKDTR